MSKTPSTMLALGTTAPYFSLKNAITDQTVALHGPGTAAVTVILFICNHCPYVMHLNQPLVELANEYQAKGVAFYAISSNDVENYPQDGPAKMKQHALSEGYPFPYLYDETQSVAKSYQAACTPDFFVFDKALSLAYRGQFDSSRPGNGVPATGEDLRAALNALVNGKKPVLEQRPSLGCNIKWKQ